MGKVFEAIRRFALHERLMQKFEKEVAMGEVSTIDVFLKMGIEYIVRGKIVKGRRLQLSVDDITGLPVCGYSGDDGRYISFAPEKDGLYRIRAAVGPAVKDREPALVSVILSCAIPSPTYLVDGIAGSGVESENDG